MVVNGLKKLRIALARGDSYRWHAGMGKAAISRNTTKPKSIDVRPLT